MGTKKIQLFLIKKVWDFQKKTMNKTLQKYKTLQSKDMQRFAIYKCDPTRTRTWIYSLGNYYSIP